MRHYSSGNRLFRKEVVAFESIPEHCRILDLGCGTGRTTRFLRRESRSLVGLDIAFPMVAAARASVPGVPFVAGDAAALCFHDHRFDVVVFSFNGLDHVYPLEHRRAALREIRRVLKPRGLFIFSAHNHCIPRSREGIPPFLRSIFRKGRNGYVRERHGARGTMMTYLTTPAIQIAELRDLGFEVLRLVPHRILQGVASLALIGLLDPWVYYVCRQSERRSIASDGACGLPE